MKNNFKNYQNSLRQNINEIEEFIHNLGMEKLFPKIYQAILNKTSSFIISRWKTGRKYARTLFVQKAFGRLYPAQHTTASLCLDAMVNILDDLLDEQLDKARKEQYVIEFLRVFSVYSITSTALRQKWTGTYFNKLITLAVAEQIYRSHIAREKLLDVIVKYSADLLVCRGMDIDIFIQIALSPYSLSLSTQQKILEVGRIFRALNILKKDINDIEYDKKNNIATVVLIIYQRRDIDFQDYIQQLVDSLLERQKKAIKLAMKSLANNQLSSVIKRLYYMSKRERNKILQTINFL